MLKRLRIKFICINMAIVTVILAVIFGLVIFSTRQNLAEQSIRMMQSVMAEPEEFSPPDQFGELNRPVRVRDEVLLPYFTLQEKDGVLSASGNTYYDLTDEDFLSDLKAAVESQGGETGVLSDYNLRFYRHSDPMGKFIVFADTSSEQATVNSLIRTSALVGIISFLVFLGISCALARWAVRPVERAWEQQRQFVADASHELKTPLTVITTNAELLKSPDCSDAERERFAGSILTMSGQMRGLIDVITANGAGLSSYNDLNSFIQGRTVFCPATVSDYSAEMEAGIGYENVGFIPLYCGVGKEEDQGLCTNANRFWCVNENASEEDQKAALDFISWVAEEEISNDILADEMGICTPFVNAKTPRNPLIAMMNESLATRKNPVVNYLDVGYTG